jgi:hypothetical protein
MILALSHLPLMTKQNYNKWIRKHSSSTLTGIVDTARYHFLAWKKSQMNYILISLEHNVTWAEYSLDIILEIGKVEASQEDKTTWLIQKKWRIPERI